MPPSIPAQLLLKTASSSLSRKHSPRLSQSPCMLPILGRVGPRKDRPSFTKLCTCSLASQINNWAPLRPGTLSVQVNKTDFGLPPHFKSSLKRTVSESVHT